MTIDDIVRRIVREEIERRFPRPAPEPLQTWRDLLDRPSSCPRGCPIGTLCAASDCPMRAPTVMYDPSKSLSGTSIPAVLDDAIATGTGYLSTGVEDSTVVIKHLDNVQRTGCTCPPTSPVSACPDPTCPWKPR